LRRQLHRSGRKTTSGTKEWADRNVNCIEGCHNNCRYCYAKMNAKRFGRMTDKTWANMHIRKTAVLKTYRKTPGRIMFPSSHDIFEFPEFKEACFIVLRKLLESGNEVLVTTKPRLPVVRDIDTHFSTHREHLQFRFTITSVDDEVLAFWEPNASPFEERIECLRYAFSRNYKTSVSIEPFLDHNPKTLVKAVIPYSTESVWLGVMNYIPRNGIPLRDGVHYSEIRRNYETRHLGEIYEDLRSLPKVRFKDSIRNRLGLDENGERDGVEPRSSVPVG